MNDMEAPRAKVPAHSDRPEPTHEAAHVRETGKHSGHGSCQRGRHRSCRRQVPTVVGRLLTYQEAAQYLAITERLVRKLVETRQLPSVKVNSLVRLERGDLDGYIDDHRRPLRPVNSNAPSVHGRWQKSPSPATPLGGASSTWKTRSA